MACLFLICFCELDYTLSNFENVTVSERKNIFFICTVIIIELYFLISTICYNIFHKNAIANHMF